MDLWRTRESLLAREQQVGRRDLAARRALNERIRLRAGGPSVQELQGVHHNWKTLFRDQERRRMRAQKQRKRQQQQKKKKGKGKGKKPARKGRPKARSEPKRVIVKQIGGDREELKRHILNTEEKPIAVGGYGAVHRVKGDPSVVVKFLYARHKELIVDEWTLSKLTSDLGVAIKVFSAAYVKSSSRYPYMGAIAMEAMHGDGVDLIRKALRDGRVAAMMEALDRQLPAHVEALVAAGYSCHDLKSENMLYHGPRGEREPKVYLSD